MSMVKEFKEFALKGNVMDLAVGVIIGGAFGTIVTSLVNDIIMPVIGSITGGVDFSEFFLPLKAIPAGTGASLAEIRAAGVPVLAYGSFLTVLVNFLILAFIIFQMIKMMNKLKRAEPAPAPAPAVTPEDILLLREIRDNLKR